MVCEGTMTLEVVREKESLEVTEVSGFVRGYENFCRDKCFESCLWKKVLWEMSLMSSLGEG